MIRIGLVGGAKDWHGMTFSELFNGYDQKLAKKYQWPALCKTPLGENAGITHIWDKNVENAKEVASVCGIENVVAEKEAMLGEVDAVILPDDCTLKHQRNAIPFLKAGLPTFVDKPLAPNLREAEEIVRLARRHKAPFMSCSALRYARETEDLRKGRGDDIGDILTGYAVCCEWTGKLIFYGIHALELLYSIVGPGVKSFQNLGKKTEDLLLLRYRDGRKFMVAAYEGISPTFQVHLYGTRGSRSIVVRDSEYFYSEMLRAFIGMVKTGKEPICLEETLEIIKILE